MKHINPDAQQNYVKTCVDCGGNTLVIDSRPTPQGGVLRKRKCPDCGYIFTTIEVEESMFDNYELLEEIKELRAQNKKLRDKVHKIKSVLDVLTELGLVLEEKA